MTTFIVHYSQRSRWDQSVTLHRDGCGKVPYEGPPGRKRQGIPVDHDHVRRHVRDAERSPDSYKICTCARKALRTLEVTHSDLPAHPTRPTEAH